MTLPRPLARAASSAIDRARSRYVFAGAASVGRGVRLYGLPRVVAEGRLVIGRDVVFVSSPAAIELFVANGAELVIGDGAVIESGAVVRAARSVVLGRQSRVGVGCQIDDAPAGGIVVSDEAWIDDGVVLVGGAHIPAGAVVTRGGVVGVESAAPRAKDRPIDDELGTLSEAETRVREIIGQMVPAAARAPHGSDLRLYEGWDSLAALRILVALEKEFAVRLPYDLFSRERAIESLVPLVLGENFRAPP